MVFVIHFGPPLFSIGIGQSTNIILFGEDVNVSKVILDSFSIDSASILTHQYLIVLEFPFVSNRLNLSEDGFQLIFVPDFSIN